METTGCIPTIQCSLKSPHGESGKRQCCPFSRFPRRNIVNSSLNLIFVKRVVFQSFSAKLFLETHCWRRPFSAHRKNWNVEYLWNIRFLNFPVDVQFNFRKNFVWFFFHIFFWISAIRCLLCSTEELIKIKRSVFVVGKLIEAVFHLRRKCMQSLRFALCYIEGLNLRRFLRHLNSSGGYIKPKEGLLLISTNFEILLCSKKFTLYNILLETNFIFMRIFYQFVYWRHT